MPNLKPGINYLSFTRDGKTLLVGTLTGQIRFVDPVTGEVKRTLRAHSSAVYMTMLTRDEKLLASSSRDNNAKIWDVVTGRELHNFNGFRCSVKAVAFSPDDLSVAASGNDGMLKFWDVKTGTELKSLVHRDSPDIDMATYAFVFSRDGKQIYAGNGDGTISVWDIATGKEIRNWKAHQNTVFKVLISSDHHRLISLGDGVKVWDTTTWRQVQELSVPKPSEADLLPSALAISHNGKLIAASFIELDRKRNVYAGLYAIVWNAKTGERLFSLSGHKLDINALTFTRDDRFLLTGSVDTTIKFWDMSNGQEARTITMH
jgi:WD40 repeat protein